MKALLLVVPCVVWVTSCASTNYPAVADPGSISDTPDRFLVLEVATGARSEPVGPACRNPMVDPRDGTRLTLVRSSGGFGDYAPESARYGLASGQLLRINCSDGRPVGATR